MSGSARSVVAFGVGTKRPSGSRQDGGEEYQERVRQDDHASPDGVELSARITPRVPSNHNEPVAQVEQAAPLRGTHPGIQIGRATSQVDDVFPEIASRPQCDDYHAAGKR